MPTYRYTGPPQDSISFPGGITLSDTNPVVQTTLVLEAYANWDPTKVTRVADTPRPDLVILSQVLTAPGLITGLEKSKKIIINPSGRTTFRINDELTEEITIGTKIELHQNHPFVEKINFTVVPAGGVEVVALNVLYDIQLIT